MLPADFDAGALLYFNPELVVQSNLNTAQKAHLWAFSNSNVLDSYVYDLNVIPNNFDAKLFLISGNNTLDISGLNQAISQSLQVEGVDILSLQRRAEFVDTIGQDALCTSNNVFLINIPQDGSNNFVVSPNNINTGDTVLLRQFNKKVYEYGTVAQINEQDNSIQINSESTRPYRLGQRYFIAGIKLFDYERLARINYARFRLTSNTEPPFAYIQDDLFNPDLYKLLYPESRFLSDVDAYIEYISLQSNNERRVAKVHDLVLEAPLITNAVENLQVNYQLRMSQPKSSFVFDDVTIFGISANSNSSSHDLEFYMTPPKLITEYAIKKYVDRHFDEYARFCNVDIFGTTSVYGDFRCYGNFLLPLFSFDDVIVNCNLNCIGTASFSNNVAFSSHVNLQSIQVNGTTNFFSEVICHSNIVIESNCTLCNLGTTHLSQNVYIGSNCIVNGLIHGGRIGIGSMNLTVEEEFLRPSLQDLHVSNTITVGSSNDFSSNVGTFYGNILANSVVADAFVQFSDKRLKYDIHNINHMDALEVIKLLKPCQYKRVNSDQTEIGFIADEIEKVLPEAVTNYGSRKISCYIQATVHEVQEAIVSVIFDHDISLLKGDILLNEDGITHEVLQNSQSTSLLYTNCAHQVQDRICFKQLVINNAKSINTNSIVALLVGAINKLTESNSYLS